MAVYLNIFYHWIYSCFTYFGTHPPFDLHTLDFFIGNLGFGLKLGLVNSETEIGAGFD